VLSVRFVRGLSCLHASERVKCLWVRAGAFSYVLVFKHVCTSSEKKVCDFIRTALFVYFVHINLLVRLFICVCTAQFFFSFSTWIYDFKLCSHMGTYRASYTSHRRS